MARLSEELHRYFFEEKDRGKTVSLAQVIALAGEKVFGVILLLLALPAALPIPAVGYSTMFGILIVAISFQMIVGRQALWLPLSWQRKTLKTETAQDFLEKGLPWLRKVEAIAHPRFLWLCQSRPGRILMGCTISLMATSMMIPIPGTNTLPAIAIFLTAFGLQEDDGLICVVGMFFSIMIAGIMISVIYVFFNGGLSLLDILKDWVIIKLGTSGF